MKIKESFRMAANKNKKEAASCTIKNKICSSCLCVNKNKNRTDKTKRRIKMKKKLLTTNLNSLVRTIKKTVIKSLNHL